MVSLQAFLQILNSVNNRSSDNLSQSNTAFKQNLEKAYRMLESFDTLYNQSDIYGKQRLIGSIFP